MSVNTEIQTAISKYASDNNLTLFSETRIFPFGKDNGRLPSEVSTRDRDPLQLCLVSFAQYKPLKQQKSHKSLDAELKVPRIEEFYLPETEFEVAILVILVILNSDHSQEIKICHVLGDSKNSIVTTLEGLKKLKRR